MKHYFLGLIFLMSLVISCNSEDIESYNVGSDFLENEINITVLDSFKINTSTFRINPTITSSTQTILLGNIENDLGPLKASTFLELSRSSFDVVSTAEYDSIGFVLKYNNYHYGDTLNPINTTYKVYQLDDLVRSTSEDDTFNNTDAIPFSDTNLLGQITFKPRPNQEDKDSVYIPLDDIIGEDLFNKIRTNEITSEEEFLSEFKGIAIVPDETNDNILGFNVSSIENTLTNSSLRMYYTEEDGGDDIDDNAATYLDFVALDLSKQFNSIFSEDQLASSDYPILSDIQNDGKVSISSIDTDNKTFIQSGTGISTKLEIPGIKNIKNISEFGATLEAELVFRPTDGTHNSDFPLPEQLSVYIIDRNNEIVTTANNPLTAVLTENSEFSEDIFYSVDLTSFVQLILESEIDLNYSFMIQYEDYEQRVDRVILDDSFADNNQMKLSVKYLNF